MLKDEQVISVVPLDEAAVVWASLSVFEVRLLSDVVVVVRNNNSVPVVSNGRKVKYIDG